MWTRLWPLAITKFFTSFNDNAFKVTVMFVAMGLLRAAAGPAGPETTAALEAQQAALLAGGSVVFMLPFVLFPTVAGWLADRFSKRRVLLAAKTAELGCALLGLVAFALLGRYGIAPLLVALFLMTVPGAFLSPAFYGVMPETFAERELSQANGTAELINFLGIILGIASAGLTVLIPAGYFTAPTLGTSLLIGLPFVGVAGLGLTACWFVRPTRAGNPAEKPGWRLLTDYVRDFRYVLVARPIWLCVAGQAFFWSLGLVLTTSLVSYGMTELKLNELQTSLLSALMAVGIGFGCFVAGKFSGDKIEFGLVPIGALGLTVFLINLILANGFALALGVCFLLGVCGGFFILPLAVYVQERTPAAVRGKTLATANAVTFWAMLLTSLLMLALTGGTGGAAAAGADFWTRVRANFLTLGTRELFGVTAVAMALGSLYVFWLLPDFLVRLLAVLLTRLVYRLRVSGRAHLPTTGPVLLVANHATLVDGLLLTAASSRFIYFVVDERYFANPWLRPFAKWAGFVPLPAAGGNPVALKKALAQAQAVLRRGDVLCVFPEGRLTGTGAMGQFRAGFLKMLPPDLPVPVVPVHLGLLWGSIFSRFHGRAGLRLPRQLPYPVNISFGAPLAPDLTPGAARLAVAELAAVAASAAAAGERTLAEQFIRQAHRRPFARRFKDSSGHTASSLELLALAHHLAADIRRRAAPDERYVGLLLPTSTVAAAFFVAALLADRVPVFLNYTASREALAHASQRCGLRRLYTSRVFLDKVRVEVPAELVYAEDLLAAFRGAAKRGAVARAWLPAWLARRWYFPATARSVHNVATVLFSSGSAGLPKGVVLTHHNLTANLDAVLVALDLPRATVILGALPFFHAFGFLAALWLPLTHGLRVVWHPNPLDAEAIGRLVAAEGVTGTFSTPTFLQTYLRKCQPEQFRSLRLVITGAEKLPPRVATHFAERFGVLPLEGYGATELSPVVSLNVPENFADLGRAVGRLGSVGVPLPGIAVKTVDPVSLATYDDGREGLLCVKGPNVMQEYLGEPDRTADVLRDGWYHTGDLARLDADGYLYITGRASRFSKIAGEMVPHAAVEDHLQQVTDALEPAFVVVGLDHPQRGERLVVLHLPLAVPVTEILARLRQRGLPNLWVPKPADFHQVAALPMLGSGKLDLRQARDLARSLSDQRAHAEP